MQRYESTCWPVSLSLLSEFFHASRDLFNLIISLDPCDTGFLAHVTKNLSSLLSTFLWPTNDIKQGIADLEPPFVVNFVPAINNRGW